MSNMVKSGGFSIAPQNLTEAMAWAEMAANSSMVPNAYKGKAGDVLIAAQMGDELGLKPIQALQNIAVINGRPSIYGDAALAIVQSNPDYEWHSEEVTGDGDNMVAICQIKRKSSPKATESRFSVSDARVAKLWGKAGPWTQYPKRMLAMRARGFCLRNAFANALLGLVTVEEARDYEHTASIGANTSAIKVVEDPAIDQDGIDEIEALLIETGTKEEKLLAWAGVESIDKITQSIAVKAVSMLNDRLAAKQQRGGGGA